METCIRNKFYEKCNSKFSSQFTGVPILSKSAIYRLVNKFRTTGSLLTKKPVRPACAVLDEALGDGERALCARLKLQNFAGAWRYVMMCVS